jgi:PAS domain S-box-containing protein
MENFQYSNTPILHLLFQMNMENTEQHTILIVDDTPENLKMLNAFLQEAGFRVAVAESGEAALKRVEYALPDLILLDVLMPGMDGFETCGRLKESKATKNIPVIFMTVVSDIVDKVKGFEVGGVDYLTKPVQHEEVLARINAHLTIRKLQVQLSQQNVRLQEQNERFRRLAEATFEGIVIHDGGRILEANQRMVTMFGYQQADILRKDLLELVSPESREIVLEHIQVKDERPYEAEGIRSDGSRFPVEIQSRTIPDEGHDVNVTSIRDLSWRQAMEEEKQSLLRASIQDRYKFGDIIGKSPAMQEVYQLIVKASASNSNVVICGESGTGKELVARSIHTLSERKEQGFVAVNCGAVPEALFEREFFGHRKGAFTGADRDKPGYFDQAHRGTLFLDEVGELKPALQVKLLRVLQDGEYTPLGDTISKHVDVRIIAATHRDLTEQLRKGEIRQDFFYRIRVTVINLPPLRERKEDIPLLVDHFLHHYGDTRTCSTLPRHIMKALCNYEWPGNIRELQNELQRYLTEQRLEFIGNVQVEPVEEEGFSLEGLSFNETIETFEKRVLTRALAQNYWHQGKTAAMLDIPPKTLYRKIRKYGLKGDKE